jgi:hypothetical protein
MRPPHDSIEITPNQRFRDVAKILAIGLRRALDLQHLAALPGDQPTLPNRPENPPELRAEPLEPVPPKSVTDHAS